MRRLVPLLLPALLAAACGTQVKQGAAVPSPTGTTVIPWPTVAPASPTRAATASATTSPSVSALPGRSPGASTTAAPTATASPLPLGRNPLALVGWWRVATARGEADLGLGEDAVVVHPCGDSSISWSASPTGLLVATGYGGDSACYQKAPRPDLTWLEGATAFAVSSQRLLLVDGAGAVLARGVRENPPQGHQPFLTTAGLRARLADAKQLPQGVRPVTSKALQRRWVPRGDDAGNGKAFVAFGADRRWTGSDGCNAAGGRYSLGEYGEALATSGPSTLIGCSNSPAPGWVARARRLGLDKDGALVLYDAKAVLLGRLYRS